MNAIILIILGIIGIAAVVEFLNRSKSDADSGANDDNRAQTAAEAGPTQTGRYRVQQMLKNTESAKDSGVSVEPEPQEAIEKEEELPDPFDENRS